MEWWIFPGKSIDCDQFDLSWHTEIFKWWVVYDWELKIWVFWIGNRFDVFSFFLLEKCWLYLQVYLHCGTMKNHQIMGDKWRTHTIPDFSNESKTKITTSIPITSLVWTDNRRRGILPLFALPWAQLKYQSQFFIIWFWLGGE